MLWGAFGRDCALDPVEMSGFSFHDLPRDAFVARFGGIYEHSPWVAEETWDQGLHKGTDGVEHLRAALAARVEAAPRDRRLALIRAHPELAGGSAALTAASTSEQTSAGLDACSPDELVRFAKLNKAYRERFGFPFVMAVKGRSRHEILAAFEARLANEPDQEFATAMAEIHKIARLRLVALTEGDS